jgi:hypothetical protein
MPPVSDARSLGHRLRLRMRHEPQRAGGPGRIEPEFLPPPGFITVTMDLAMIPRQSGTVNSSLTLRPRARFCVKRR